MKTKFLGDIVVGLICYRPPDQEEQADGTLYRHVGAASHSKVLVLLGKFIHLISIGRTAAGHKQSRRFLKHVGRFPFQVIGEPKRRGTKMDLILTNKERLLGNTKVKGILGCSDHMFKIPKAARKVHSNLGI